MKLRVAKLLAVFGLMYLSGHTAFAWSATGHMIAATIAYRSLSPELQLECVTILEAHPDHSDWMKNDEANVDEGAYVFMRASVWPDELRDQGNPDAHAEWHYINYPLIPPTYPEFPALPSPKGNIVTAIEFNRQILTNQSVSLEDQAIALAWLLHLIGDLHQPLHTVALVNETYPEGDRGGNDYFVRLSDSATTPVSLHSVWDGLLGTTMDSRKAHSDATALTARFPQESFGRKMLFLTIEDWALSSRGMARTYPYSGAQDGVPRKRLVEAPILNSDYRIGAKNLAGSLIVLAGYRLADLLRGDLQVDAE